MYEVSLIFVHVEHMIDVYTSMWLVLTQMMRSVLLYGVAANFVTNHFWKSDCTKIVSLNPSNILAVNRPLNYGWLNG